MSIPHFLSCDVSAEERMGLHAFNIGANGGSEVLDVEGLEC